jgi:hypothetical protein
MWAFGLAGLAFITFVRTSPIKVYVSDSYDNINNNYYHNRTPNVYLLNDKEFKVHEGIIVNKITYGNYSRSTFREIRVITGELWK